MLTFRNLRWHRLAVFVVFGVCFQIWARIVGLILAPLIFIRGHATFEILFQKACKYALKRAKQKVGVPSFTDGPWRAQCPIFVISDLVSLLLFYWKVDILVSKINVSLSHTLECLNFSCFVPCPANLLLGSLPSNADS